MLKFSLCLKAYPQKQTEIFLLRSNERTIYSMKKIICKIEYDTEASELIEKRVNGEFGDPAGYEECLYRTPDGKFFIYGRGGESSPYPAEAIRRLSPAKAEEWKQG